MKKKAETRIDTWNDAIGGKSKNPIGDGEIKSMAEKGNLVVIDNDGNRLVPVRFGENWKLEPEKK